jgi:hypothetical protein
MLSFTDMSWFPQDIAGRELCRQIGVRVTAQENEDSELILGSLYCKRRWRVSINSASRQSSNCAKNVITRDGQNMHLHKICNFCIFRGFLAYFA